MSTNPPRYLAYLIRLWADDQSPPVWRFSAENTQTQARRGFGTLEELVAFLQNSMNESEQGMEPRLPAGQPASCLRSISEGEQPLK